MSEGVHRMISRSSTQDQRSTIGLVTVASIRGPHVQLRARLALRVEVSGGVEPEAGGGSGQPMGDERREHCTHIRTGWAECIHSICCPAISISRFLGQGLGIGR